MTDKLFSNVEISWGTHINDDIMESIMDFARANELQDVVELCNEYFETDKEEHKDWIAYEEIYDMMQAYADDNNYFGMHPGDGSSLGFWECEPIDFDDIDIPEI